MTAVEREHAPTGGSGRLDFLAAAPPLVAVCVLFATYVPIWDASFYLACLQTAFGPRQGAAFMFCAAHPTGGYFAPLAAAFHLSGLRYGAVVAANAALGLIAAHAFADLLALVVPGDENRAERRLTTLIFALNPLLLACVVQLTPDFGVAVFSLCTLRALARERPGIAALSGALLCLSKETGAVIYALSCAAYLLVYVGRRPDPPRDRLRALTRQWPLALGLAPSAIWLAARLLQRGDGALWRGPGMTTPMWRQLISISWLDNVFPSQLAQIFLLNFAWVLSLFIALHGLTAVARWVTGAAPSPEADRPEARTARFVTLAFVVTVFAVTRVRTFVIPRYVLPAVVMLPLLGQLALHALGVQRRPRLLVLGLFAALSAVACFRTQDGLSLKALASYPFGSHHLIDVTAWTFEYPNRRDHIVYNLEFTHIGRLLDDALPHALADGREALAISHHAEWWLINCVDRRTRRRVICTPGAFRPAVWTLPRVRREATRPALLHYIEQPGMDDEDELIGWRRYYRIGAEREFTRGGYAITTRELRLRDDAPAPEP